MGQGVLERGRGALGVFEGVDLIYRGEVNVKPNMGVVVVVVMFFGVGLSAGEAAEEGTYGGGG